MKTVDGDGSFLSTALHPPLVSQPRDRRRPPPGVRVTNPNRQTSTTITTATVEQSTRGKRAKPANVDPKVSVRRLLSIRESQASGTHQCSSLRGTTDPSKAVCAACEQEMAIIVKMCEPALLTASELKKYERKQGQYHYTRLKVTLHSLAFDANGNYVVHAMCLRGQFGLSWGFWCHLHADVVKSSGCATTQISKAAVIAMNAQSRVMLPPGTITSVEKYLKQLQDNDKITIIAGREKFHKLTGCPSNNSRLELQRHFISFVTTHRSPTGRTADSKGRFHGSVYHLDSQFVQIKKQDGTVKDPNSGGMVARANCDDDAVLSLVFLEAASKHCPGMKLVHQQTIAKWFYAFFGVTSQHGHTELHPHSTDACAECSSIAIDVKSLTMSLSRHKQQHDQGSIDRQSEIKQITDEMSELRMDLKEHRKEAAEAEQYHKECIKGAFHKHVKVCTRFENFLHSISSITAEAEVECALNVLVEAAKTFEFEEGSDYQEDKSLQNWGLSPQPGPVYFMSHETAYVHILMAPSCGEVEGTSTTGRRIIYMRSETIGGSKDCNDTTSTIFDYWLAPVTSTCQQPPKFRTGYDTGGVILDTPMPVAESRGTTATEVSATEVSVFPNVPECMSVCTQPPTSEHFDFGSECGATLVGCLILFKWPNAGWLVGEIVRQNMSRSVKVGRECANFVCTYALDGEEGVHRLATSTYAMTPNCPDSSWVMLTSAVTSRGECIEIQDASFTPPNGFAFQQNPPQASQLRLKSPAGSALLGRHILCKWNSHGWLQGVITEQNANGRLKQHGETVNFIVRYQRTRDEAEHSLRVENYAVRADADEHSWVLLCDAETFTRIDAPYEHVKIDPCRPQPFLRHVHHIMDNCTGTNKSQFVFGTVSMSLAAAVLDVFAPYFSIPGHTKFECDITAQKTATLYHRSDTFNIGMLHEICQRYAASHVYDGSLLRTWKEAEQDIFAAVKGITSYRLFLLVADDGLMDLKEMEAAHPRMAAYKELEGKEEGFVSDSNLDEEVTALKARSLRRVMEQIRNHEYSGVGAGSGHFNAGEPRLFPKSLQTLRHVRLFKKMRNSDELWLEQVGYHKVQSVNAFCAAMAKAVPYAASNIPGQCAKVYWGARAQQISEQYAKFVPPMYVPDEYELSQTGCSGKVKAAVQQLTMANFFRPSLAAQEAPNKRKFGGEDDYEAVMQACLNGVALKKQTEIKALADNMGLEYAQVKSAIGRLIKKKKLSEPK